MTERPEVQPSPEGKEPSQDRVVGFRSALDIFELMGIGHLEPLISRSLKIEDKTTSNHEIYLALMSAPEKYALIVIRNMRYFEPYIKPDDEKILLDYAREAPYDREGVVSLVLAAIARVHRTDSL